MPNKLMSETNINLTVSYKNSEKLIFEKSSILFVKKVSTSRQLIIVADRSKFIFSIDSERV